MPRNNALIRSALAIAATLGMVMTPMSAATVTQAAATPTTEVSAAAPCPYSGIHPVLQNGSDGGAVKHLQCLLRLWGYTAVAVDGHFGPITESAVEAHQRDCKIQRDGVVGPETWRHLHLDTTTDECTD
ncbi:peptidoglycan-binding domain-containing protein [Lentzea sp. NPDC005914]|uniref:peptidoglycan-binding domain-containing protein n=1 Tax=Lentzea sp. NPDC005914 TaxID=3154572 RepID=UPI0033E2622B